MGIRTLSKTIDLNQSPNKYITEINNGITIHPIVMANGSHYTQIDGNGFYIKQYVDGINDISLGEYTDSTIQLNNGIQELLINETGIKIQENSIPIAQFGTVTQIGADDNAKIRMTPTNLQILTSQRVQAFGVDTTAKEETLEVTIFLSNEEEIYCSAVGGQSVTQTVTLGLNDHSEISNRQTVTLKFSSIFTTYNSNSNPAFDITLTKGQNQETTNPISIISDSYVLGTYSYIYVASTDQFTITLSVNSAYSFSGTIFCYSYIATQSAYVPEITLNGDVYINKKILKNFITEQDTKTGNHGTWYYRKWSDGLVEAWYNMDSSVSVAITDSVAGTYRGTFNVTIPSGLFTQTPIGGYVNFTNAGSTIHGNLFMNTNVQATAVVTRDSSSTANLTGFFYIMGYE